MPVNKFKYYFECPCCKKSALYADRKPTVKNAHKINFKVKFGLPYLIKDKWTFLFDVKYPIHCIRCYFQIFDSRFRLTDSKKPLKNCIYIGDFKKCQR